MPDLPSRLALRLAPALLVLALGCREHTGPATVSELGPAGEFASAATVTFRQVSAGNSNTCAVDDANQAYCWGSGALGAGPTTFSPTPIPVLGGQAFRKVSAGWAHACGVTVAGALFCWGSSRSGELGDGTGIDRLRPVRVARGLRFLQVSAGQLHTCAVAVDHAAYCWGHNQAGPLGNGSFTSDATLLPVLVVGNLAFRELSAGNEFACGVTTGDVAYCWGLNNTGQLGFGPSGGPDSCFTGDGLNPCSTKPVRVRRGLAFRRVDAGESHACGVTTDGVAYCWGASFRWPAWTRHELGVRGQARARRRRSEFASLGVRGSTPVAARPTVPPGVGEGTPTDNSGTALTPVRIRAGNFFRLRHPAGESYRRHRLHSGLRWRTPLLRPDGERTDLLLGQQRRGSARRRHDEEPREAKEGERRQLSCSRTLSRRRPHILCRLFGPHIALPRSLA